VVVVVMNEMGAVHESWGCETTHNQRRTTDNGLLTRDSS
jgi:hypothetical protein